MPNPNFDFNREIENFSKKFQFNPDERMLFGFLLTGETEISELSSLSRKPKLKIEKDLNSLLSKTNTQSTSQLASLFVKTIVESYHTAEMLTKKPRVLVVDDEQELCEIMSEELADMGLDVYSQVDSRLAMDDVASLKLDAVVTDVRMPHLDGKGLLKKIKEAYRYIPQIYIMTGFCDYTKEELMKMGAAAYFEKPFDADEVFTKIIENYLDSPYESDTMFRTPCQLKANINTKIHSTLENVGFGGAFVSVQTETLEKLQLREGSLVPLNFLIDDKQVVTQAEVVWIRPTSTDKHKSGIGVKFSHPSEEAKSAIDDYVKTRKLLSYIPNATTKNSATA